MEPKTEMMGNIKKLFWNLVRFLIVQIHWMFDSVVDFAFGLYYSGKQRKVPPIKNKLLLESGVSLAEKIR